MNHKKFYQKIKAAFLMPQAEALSQVHSGKKALAASLLVLFISLAGIGALFSLTFRWDNKYTYCMFLRKAGSSILISAWTRTGMTMMRFLTALKSSPLVNMEILNLSIPMHRPSVPPFIENSCTLSRQQKDGF